MQVQLLFFSCYDISALLTYLVIKHLHFSYVSHVLLTALISYNIMSNSDLTFSSLIEYFKSKFNHNGVFYKKHIPVLRIKVHGLMILIKVSLMSSSNWLS